MPRVPLLALAAVAAATGVAAATPADNGKYINGKYINGKYINGVVLDGTYVGGTWVPAISTPDTGPLADVHLEGSRIVGSWTMIVLGRPRAVRIEPGAGATLHATLDGGGTVPLRITQMVTGTATAAIPELAELGARNQDLSYYQVEHEAKRTEWLCTPWGCWPYEVSEWKPLCEHGPNWVVPFAGTWSHAEGEPGDGGRASDDGFTFACVQGALGKCMTMGYRPWEVEYVYDPSVSPVFPYRLIDHARTHQACVRMVRADYCGDGVARTIDGTRIDVADSFSPPRNQPEPSDATWVWSFEAVWGPAGATCLSRPRYEELVRLGLWGCGEPPYIEDGGVIDPGEARELVLSDACPIDDDQLFNHVGTMFWRPDL